MHIKSTCPEKHKSTGRCLSWLVNQGIKLDRISDAANHVTSFQRAVTNKNRSAAPWILAQSHKSALHGSSSQWILPLAATSSPLSNPSIGGDVPVVAWVFSTTGAARVTNW
jgi:hypothetical protein